MGKNSACPFSLLRQEIFVEILALSFRNKKVCVNRIQYFISRHDACAICGSILTADRVLASAGSSIVTADRVFPHLDRVLCRASEYLLLWDRAS